MFSLLVDPFAQSIPERSDMISPANNLISNTMICLFIQDLSLNMESP
jgi:hypothetical protein